MFTQKKVRFVRPAGEDSEWFNIFVLHQNRDNKGRGAKNCIHETMIPEFMVSALCSSGLTLPLHGAHKLAGRLTHGEGSMRAKLSLSGFREQHHQLQTAEKRGLEPVWDERFDFGSEGAASTLQALEAAMHGEKLQDGRWDKKSKVACGPPAFS